MGLLGGRVSEAQAVRLVTSSSLGLAFKSGLGLASLLACRNHQTVHAAFWRPGDGSEGAWRRMATASHFASGSEGLAAACGFARIEICVAGGWRWVSGTGCHLLRDVDVQMAAQTVPAQFAHGL